MDIYYGYTQIPMHNLDINKTIFINEHSSYIYNAMPFSLKNTIEKYQRMIKKDLWRRDQRHAGSIHVWNDCQIQ